MQDASSYFYIVSYTLYFASLILLIIFCIKPNNNRLWAIAIVLLIFGAFLEKDMLLPTFLSIFYSGIMVIIFGSKGNIIYSIGCMLILLSAILSAAFSNIFIFAIFAVVIFPILNNVFFEKKSPQFH